MYEMLKRQLAFEEGKRLHVYLCTAGHRTIGIGHNLDADPYHHGSRIPNSITETECDAIFIEDVTQVVEGLKKRWKGFQLLDAPRRDAVANMAFQMGVGGFLEFHNTMKCLERCDWSGAYRSAMQSKWARQTPERAKRVMGQILSGVYYEVPK